jgi:hypothetical protein
VVRRGRHTRSLYEDASGVLLVAEIKPAVTVCLVDGENQVLGYIDAGNAPDDQQAAWRASFGLTVVSPMLEKHYDPPSLSTGVADVETAWCGPGLLAYTVHTRNKVPVPVPIPAPKQAPDEDKKKLKEKLPSVPDWVWAAIGAAAVALIVACFASGVCEAGAIAAAIAAAVGEAAEFITPIVLGGLRAAGAF